MPAGKDPGTTGIHNRYLTAHIKHHFTVKSQIHFMLSSKLQSKTVEILEENRKNNDPRFGKDFLR